MRGTIVCDNSLLSKFNFSQSLSKNHVLIVSFGPLLTKYNVLKSFRVDVGTLILVNVSRGVWLWPRDDSIKINSSIKLWRAPVLVPWDKIHFLYSCLLTKVRHLHLVWPNLRDLSPLGHFLSFIYCQKGRKLPPKPWFLQILSKVSLAFCMRFHPPQGQ